MKIYLDSVGCRLNQSEIESFARQFRAAGHQLVGSSDQADLIVINTCTVTSAAAADSRQKLRQATRASTAQVVVTGCWASLNPDQAAGLPTVRWVVNNRDKDHLVPLVLQTPEPLFDEITLERQPLPGGRSRTRAFIKVQDGCNNHCTYCITRLARGASRSRTIPQVLDDIHAAARGGAQEIVITGVHLGAWGEDLFPSDHLRHLVQIILSDTDVPRLRLSSLEPWDLQPDFFNLWQDRRLCRHLHLPLQSGCETTLRQMARKTTPAAFASLVQMARSAIPQVAVATDIIVGFPGETGADFDASLDFVQRMQFAGGHVFTYSERPGTPAASFPGSIPHAERKARNARMQSVLSEAEQTYRQSFVGQELAVLWESALPQDASGWELSGLTDNYLRVRATSEMRLWNRITPVKLTHTNQHGLVGQVLC